MQFCGWPLMVSWNTPDHVGDPGLRKWHLARSCSNGTDETRLNRYGERIFNLQRAILLREGRSHQKMIAPKISISRIRGWIL